MKLFSILIFSFPIALFSQITLDVTAFADGGDTVRVSSTTDNTIDFVTTGPNTNWNFSGLIAESQELKVYNDLENVGTLINFNFGSFAAPEYKATNFAEDNNLPLEQAGGFLPISISEINQFSKNAVDSITSVGLSMVVEGTEIPIKSDTIETRYKFPLNFNDTYSSRGYTYLDLNPIFNGIWIQYRQRYSEVDGWGSITTPYGSFDVLRVRHEIHETDSLQVDFGGGAMWIELPVPISYEYEWITQDELYPVLKIRTNDIGGSETVTGIEYKDVYLGLDASLSKNELNVSIGPNPVENVININGIQGEYDFQIISSNGQEILSGKHTSQSLKMDELPTGEYILKLDKESKSSIFRFIKL